MNPFLFGTGVGIGLALLNFLASTFLSSKVIQRSKLTSVLIALAGFIGRLTGLGLIFYGLSRVKGIHFQAALVSFLICFTLLLVVKTIRFYRQLGTVPWKLIGR
ncbi:MAG: hypothetical protein N3G78_10755 [Desulfobacterota bacterium]|nr:hypothetical protein [Thermodesulfobacteriota bacterium]